MISSVGNPKVKRIVSLQSRGREREKEKVFVTEGKKMFMEAPVSWIREIYLAQDKRERMEDGDFLERLRVCKDGGAVLETVSGEVFAKMSDTMAPQGILCVLGRPRFDRERILEKALRQKEEKGRPPLFLLLEDIQDPGNLGTMIRTAEGAGADALFMTGGTVDIYNPKTIRATMGSLYRVPFFYVDGLKETIELLRQRGITVYAAHLKGEKFYQEMDYAGGSAFLIGNEARGLRQETAECADCFLRIPMEGELESLNAAVAAALLMYQSRFEKK